MRTFFILLTGLILTQATLSKADEQDFDLEEADFAETFDIAAAATWNRWTCIATRPFDFRLYRGSSFYFRGQSGEGQQAKLIAQKIALRLCEYSTNATNCTSNLAKCTVESH